MRLRLLSVSLFVVAIAAATVNAGPVYLSLVLDPATAANAGGLDGTSTQSGAGTWHLFAFDDHTGSLGIASYSVTMSGINTIFNRAPGTLFGEEGGEEDAGFRLLRSANDATAPVGANANPLTGAQPLAGSTSVSPIMGFGRESSDFATKLPGAPLSVTTSSAWGDYATDPETTLKGLFLAEGTYTVGTAPTLDAFRIQVYNSATEFSVVDTEECIAGTAGCILPGGTTENTPPTVTDHVVPGYNANLPGDPQTLVHQFVATDTEDGAGPFAWDQLQLLNYTANYGAENGNPVPTGPLLAPTLSAGGLFNWVSEGSPRGDYVWQVRATDSGGLSDLGTITVNVTAVPEPSTLALFGLAMVGGLGLVRRRNG